MNYQNNNTTYFPIIDKNANVVYSPLSFAANNIMLAPFSSDMHIWRVDRSWSINQFSDEYGESTWGNYLTANEDAIVLNECRVLTSFSNFGWNKTSNNSDVTLNTLVDMGDSAYPGFEMSQVTQGGQTVEVYNPANIFWNMNILPASFRNEDNLKMNVEVICKFNSDLFTPQYATGTTSNFGPAGLSQFSSKFVTAGLQQGEIINNITVAGTYQPYTYDFYIRIKGTSRIAAVQQGSTAVYADIGNHFSANTTDYTVHANLNSITSNFWDDTNWTYLRNNPPLKKFYRERDPNNVYFVAGITLNMSNLKISGTNFSAFSTPLFGYKTTDNCNWTNATAIATCTNSNTYTATGDFTNFVGAYPPSIWNNKNFSINDFNFGLYTTN